MKTKKNKLKKNLITRLLALLITVSSLGTLCSQEALASHNIKVAYGKLSLIDLGSVIQNQITVLDESLVRVYPLSGLSDEDKKSIIAIQGLAKSGETDISVRTSSGIYQFHLALNPSICEDFVLEPSRARIKILKSKYPLAQERMTISSMPSHINEYVLAGNPNLISLKQIVQDDDPEFLKTFALASNSQEGETNIVVASKSGVFKFDIDIKANNYHTENISLNMR